jgi:hypothetical protein
MPFKMTHHTFLTLIKYSFLSVILTTCNQVGKQSSNSNKVDSLKSINQVASADKNEQDTSIEFSNLENKIIDTIFQLKEIKDRQKYIDRQTNGARHLQIWIADKPNLTNKYYWVKVGEDNGTNLVTHFNFDVYPDSMRIMFFDTQDDKEITLKEWRKLNGM